MIRIINSPVSQGKTQTGVAESRRVTSETSAHGQPCGHLSQSGHDEEDDEADERVADEDGARAGLRERLAGSNDQTGTDGAADGNHGNVASLESTLQRGLGRGLETADVARQVVVGAGMVRRLFGVIVWRRRLVGGGCALHLGRVAPCCCAGMEIEASICLSVYINMQKFKS